jgi:hypothetical protein
MPVAATFWHNWGGTLIGVAVGVIGIVISLVIASTQRYRKFLTWEIVASQSILAAIETPKDLQVVWKGSTLTAPRIITVRVTNAGNREIAQTDYERPLRFLFEQTIVKNVETVEVSGPAPEQLAYEYGETSVRVTDILMNTRDYFVLQILVDGENEQDITVDCRIVGETQPIELVRTGLDLDPVALYEVLGAALPFPLGGMFRRCALIIDYLRSSKRTPRG